MAVVFIDKDVVWRRISKLYIRRPRPYRTFLVLVISAHIVRLSKCIVLHAVLAVWYRHTVGICGAVHGAEFQPVEQGLRREPLSSLTNVRWADSFPIK